MARKPGINRYPTVFERFWAGLFCWNHKGSGGFRRFLIFSSHPLTGGRSDGADVSGTETTSVCSMFALSILVLSGRGWAAFYGSGNGGIGTFLLGEVGFRSWESNFKQRC